MSDLSAELEGLLRPHVEENLGQTLVTLLEFTGQLAVALWMTSGTVDYYDFCDQVHDILSGEMEVESTIH